MRHGKDAISLSAHKGNGFWGVLGVVVVVLVQAKKKTLKATTIKARVRAAFPVFALVDLVSVHKFCSTRTIFLQRARAHTHKKDE